MADKKKEKKFTMPKSEDKEKALKVAIEGIEKNYGAGSIMKLGSNTKIDVPVIPSGCLELDHALGIGGYPRGRIVEIYGPESSGKTTLALHAIAEVQKQGGIAAFIDAEHALDPIYARNLGVNIDELYVSQPDNGEQALDICEALILSGAIDLVVVDSVAALVPKDEIAGNMGDSHVGLHARLMSQALRKLTGYVSRSNTCAIFINQLRLKIGVVYGNPETTTGGMAMKFYASIRLDVRKGETIKDGSEAIGNRTRVKIVKNKLAPPFRIAEFDMMYGHGISAVGCLLDMAADRDIVKKSGSWYSYNEERIGQGRENAKAYLKDHPDIYAEIEEKIRQTFEAPAEPEEKEVQPEKKPAATKKAGKKASAVDPELKDLDDDDLITEEDLAALDDDDLDF